MAIDRETKLTDKQLEFCDQYMLDYNATRAAIDAGYSKATARQIGCELLTKPNIRARLEFLKTDLQRLSGVTKLRTIQELRKIAYSTIEHLHKTWIERTEFEKLSSDQKAAIQSIDTKILQKNIGTNEKPDIVNVEYVKITLYNKQAALDSLSKMFGYNAAEKVDVTTNGESLNMSPEEREKRISELMKKAGK